MTTPIMRSSFQSDLLPIINDWHGDDIKLQEDIVPELCEVKPSDQAFEVEGMLMGMSLFVKKGEGQALSYDTSKQLYTPRFTHDTWALGFQITMEMMQDAKAFKEARRFTKMLAKAEKETKNILAANLINNGTNSSYTQDGGDAVSLFSASHPTPVGNQSNVITTNATLSEASLESLSIQIMNAEDMRGIRANIKPRKIVANVQLQPLLHRILKSNLRVGTTNNDPNYIREVGMFPEGAFTTPYITSLTQYAILTDVMDGLTWYDRYESAIEMDNVFDTKNAAYSKVFRASNGWINFLCAYNAAGA
jgi:hypothetical protein